jgi:hypothetical protein
MTEVKMQRMAWYVAAACSGLVSIGAAPAAAQDAGTQASSAPAPFPPMAVVYPGTREFHWTVRVPVLTIEQREFVFRAPTGITHPQRWDYEGPAVRTERRKLGSYPEFSCKYVDWTVSNECRTVWRSIYADLPIIVMRPQHLVFDVPDWRWKTQLLPIALVRCTWKEERWTVSLPVLVTEPDGPSASPTDDAMARTEVESARSTLAAKADASLAEFDDGLRALDRSIAAVEGYGADPSRVEANDGTTLDLIATRIALREQRAAAAQGFRQVRDQLEKAASTTGG